MGKTTIKKAAPRKLSELPKTIDIKTRETLQLRQELFPGIFVSNINLDKMKSTAVFSSFESHKASILLRAFVILEIVHWTNSFVTNLQGFALKNLLGLKKAKEDLCNE